MKYKLQGLDGFTLPDAEKHYAPDLSLEPIHSAITLDLDLEQQIADGHTEITIRANVAGPQTLELDAVSFDDVSLVSEATLSHRYTGKKLILNWDEPFSKGEERKVTIHYVLNQPITGLSFSKPDKTLPDNPLFAVTDNETERARYWFPCVDFPTIRTTLEFNLTADKALTILANGKLISEEVKDGRKTAHWKLDYPCPSYLACFAVGDFSRFDDKSLRDIDIAYFADSSYSPDQLERAFDATPAMLAWMEKKLGHEYPYPKYFQFAARGIGGAMENISLVSWDDKVVLDETMALEFKYIVDLINVHEMAHSYFGDAIVSYDFAHVWLKESWATYIESVWLEDIEGQVARDWQLAEEARSYIQEAKSDYVRPIVTREYDHSWNMFDMHLYPGGAWRLHMLRMNVGDEAFWAGVRDYVNQYAGKTVETIDFQRCIEKQSGLNLGSFFDQWFYSKGYPILKLNFEFDKKKGVGKFNIKQDQVDKDKDIGLFEFDLEIGWSDAEGKHHLETVHIKEKQHLFYVSMTEPKHIVLDPNQKMLYEAEFNPGEDMLKHLMAHSETINGCMQAVSELTKTAKRENLQAVREYMDRETHWGLRIHVYRELAKVGNDLAFRHIAELLVGESDPMVLETAANAAGRFRSDILREAILKKLEQPELPYRGNMALLSSLGRQRNMEDMDLLVQKSLETNWRNYVRLGAFNGLGLMRDEAVVDRLLQDVDIPTLFCEERVGRYSAMGAVYKWLPKHARAGLLDSLIDGTQVQDRFTSYAAAKALTGTGELEGLGALQALKARLSEQEGPIVRRWIKQLQAAAKPEDGPSKLKKEVEELTEKLSKIEIRLQDLEAKEDKKS